MCIRDRLLPSAQFQYIKSKTALSNSNIEPFFGSTAFYSLLVAPFLLIPFVVLYKKKRDESENDLEGNKIKRNNALAKKYLSEAAKHLQAKEPFYIALEKALHNFLKAKLKIETSEMSKEKISEILIDKKAAVSYTHLDVYKRQFSTASTIVWASSWVRASGFSHKIILPASAAAMAISACRSLGVQISTASMSSRAMRAFPSVS